jgi:hypothetical protein
MRIFLVGVIGTLGLVSVAGCGQAGATASARHDSVAAESRFLLREEPDDAIDVSEFRENASDGQTVTVVGSVGGGINPWVKGRAAFVLVDAGAAMECEETCCEEGCNCHASELTDSVIVVKFLDHKGQVISRDARDFLGIRLLDTVVVHGTAKRDKAGNVAMVADGMYIRR